MPATAEADPAIRRGRPIDRPALDIRFRMAGFGSMQMLAGFRARQRERLAASGILVEGVLMPPRSWSNVLMSLLISLLASVVAFAQGANGFDPVKSIGIRLHSGRVVLTVPPGAHLKAAFMKVTLKEGTPGKLAVGPLPPTVDKDELGDGIWHDTVAIPVKGEGLGGNLDLRVKYQPCTEGAGGLCYAPTTQTLTVSAADIPVLKAEVLTAGTAPAIAEPTSNPTPATMSAPVPTPEADQSLFWALLVAFGWGLVAAFSPCVYPMIPITLAIVGAKGGSRFRGLILSLVLVLGMAVTYMILAVAVAKIGGQFGASAQKPAFLVPVALLFALFAISLLGAFEIRLPASLQAKLQSSGPRAGLGGAFFMGLILGPISAPCVGPYFGSVLTDISQHGQVGLGALKAFLFALGMGVLFIAVGAFSAALPRSGDWLVKLKQIMGVVILGFAVWTLRYILPAWSTWALWSATTLIASAVLGAFEPAQGLLSSLRRSLALLLLAVGLLAGLRGIELGLDLQLLPAGSATKTAAAPSMWLSQDLEGALAKAKAEHKVVVVDIYAEWCAQCHELDEKTWPDPALQAWLAQKAVLVRIDTDKQRIDLAARLKIIGYPTVILLDENGRELRRIQGFQPPAVLLGWLRQ